MNNPQPLGVVVLLFQPSAVHLANLRRTAAQSPLLIVVDNSDHPPPGLADLLRDLRLTCIQNRNRGGVAGGLNRGIEASARQGAAAHLLLDQDSELPPGYVDAMIRAGAEAGAARFILGPRIFDVHAADYLPILSMRWLTLRRLNLEAADPVRLLRCSFAITSGSVVSDAAHRAIGPLREDFIIDHVDTEYCVRAARAGVPIYAVPWLTLRHAIGRRQSRRLGPLRLPVLNHDACRRYYLARNATALWYLHGWRFPALALVQVLTLSQALAVVLFEADKRTKLRALALGLLDGVLRRSGPADALHPTQSFCKPQDQVGLQRPDAVVDRRVGT
jgi:rhamnosyltransferase